MNDRQRLVVPFTPDQDCPRGLGEVPEWFALANCRGTNPELFFAEAGAVAVEAKAVCAGCVVRDECLELGLRERFGIWGGLAPKERQRLRAQRRRGAA